MRGFVAHYMRYELHDIYFRITYESFTVEYMNQNRQCHEITWGQMSGDIPCVLLPSGKIYFKKKMRGRMNLGRAK